jgi:glutathione synthase/RimK-type ligase-like ATP-grasp enzyme
MKRFARIRTKNPSARPLKHAILCNKRAIVRLGSVTPSGKVFSNRNDFVEINTVDAIQNSRSKLLMKKCFATKDVPQADWYKPIFSNNKWNFQDQLSEEEHVYTTETLSYPIVAKRVFGFQGRDMELLNDKQALETWLNKHNNLDGWLLEKFYNYAREYRLHVADGVGVFMTWRKLRTADAQNRWFFNSTNSVWVGPENNLFDKPKCWKAMEEAAVNCLKATGLNIGAVDIRVQSNKTDNPKFIVCEINSAPALGDMGVEKYKEVIKQLIDAK